MDYVAPYEDGDSYSSGTLNWAMVLYLVNYVWHGSIPLTETCAFALMHDSNTVSIVMTLILVFMIIPSHR